MSIELIERVRNEFGDRFEWHVARRGTPAERFGSATEKTIWRDEGGSLAIKYVGSGETGFFRLCCENEICVDLLPGHRLGVSAAEDASPQTIDHFLADQVIPRAMAQAGMFILHAGGVQIDKSAILFVGSSGIGKSTLTASFNIAGAVLMGDDAMVLSSHGAQFGAQPVYPSLRLLPDSIKALLPENVATTAVTHSSLKQRIDVSFCSTGLDGPLPIGAIFKLAEPSSDGEIHIRPLSIAESCMAYVENSFLLDPTDMHRVRDKLVMASSLARHIPAFALSYPRDYDRLTEVRNLILDHLA